MWYYVRVKSSFQHVGEEIVSPRGPMCFRCLMFSLSGPCELVVMLYSCISCVDSVCELFGETICNMFGCGFLWLLNVMEVFSVDGGALLDIPCMVFQRMCVLCL